MVTIITTDIHVKSIENGIINITAEFDSVQYEREPARKQAKALGLIK